MKTGPTNSLVDVPGLRVGHASRQTATADAPGALTGVTVVLAPPDGAVAGVDVRGAAPGTRETDLLDPRRLVERAHAVVFTGGSAYGLASVDGVMQGLEADGVGFPLGAPGSGRVVPIVPAAVVFDLGRGGAFGERPDAAAGLEAYRAAADTAPAHGAGGFGIGGVGGFGLGGAGGFGIGNIGAGTGAVVGRLKGGIGTASAVLRDGAAVGALVVLNAAGSAVHPATGEPYGARFGLPGEFDHLGPLPPPRLAEAQAEGLLGTTLEGPLRATTLALIGTDLTLTQAQCTMLATMGADGLARAVRPVHTMVDGDSTFALSVPRRPAPELPELHGLLAAAADCVSRAIVYALLAAEPVRTPAGDWPAYLNIQ